MEFQIQRSIDTKSTVLDATEKIQKNVIRGLPMIENDTIIGMFTVTDIVLAIANEGEKDESLIKAVMQGLLMLTTE